MRPPLILLLAALAWADPGGVVWERVEAARVDVSEGDASTLRRLRIRDLAADLVVAAAAGAVPSDLASRATRAGLVAERRGDVLLLVSAGGRDDGLLALRIGPDVPPLVLQAPHPWSDLHTGEIAAALFESGSVRALTVATARRDAPAPDGPADVARRPGSPFQAATLGLAEGLADPLVVQIHGFSADEHGPWSCVLSDGAALQPPSLLAAAARALDPLLAPFGPLADRVDVPALAATTNVQGRALAGRARFLHVELSLEARTALLAEASLREDMASALADLAERRP